MHIEASRIEQLAIACTPRAELSALFLYAALVRCVLSSPSHDLQSSFSPGAFSPFFFVF
jgi:hypothetical protein